MFETGRIVGAKRVFTPDRAEQLASWQRRVDDVIRGRHATLVVIQPMFRIVLPHRASVSPGVRNITNSRRQPLGEQLL